MKVGGGSSRQAWQAVDYAPKLYGEDTAVCGRENLQAAPPEQGKASRAGGVPNPRKLGCSQEAWAATQAAFAGAAQVGAA